MPSPDRFAVETPEPPKKASLWPEAATECPRDWVAVENGNAAANRTAGCESVPAVADQTGAAAGPALQGAVTERATQVAGLQFAPRLPQARPEPPPPTKVKARSRRGGRLGPPPNCGRKYAHWRYVNKVPTWYCK
jgi:hypothetical protein